MSDPTTLVDERTQLDLAELEDALARFRDGRLSGDELRPLRTLRGVYGQRQKDRYMLRAKVPQGILDARQLGQLGQLARTRSRGFAYLTTRQDLELHFVQLDDVMPVLRELAGVGLTTWGAGGNVVRNVTADPLGGVCPDSPFDPAPHARAVSRHFQQPPGAEPLPRKIKIAFSGCAHDHALAFIHDLGFVATEQGGRRGFRVLVGGGLGALPRPAALLEEFVPEEEVVRLCEAVVRVFARTGDRAHRNRARLKFVLERLGAEAFRAEVRRELATLPPAGSFPLPAPVLADGPLPGAGTPVPAPGRGFAAWRAANVIPQRQAGYFAVEVPLPAGAIQAEQLEALAAIAGSETAGVRATIAQSFVLRWISGERLPALHAKLAAAGLAEPIAGTLVAPVACPGTESCASALTNAKALARALREELATDELHTDPALRIRVKTSGCPNSCGQHHAAELGLQGCVLHVEGRLLPCYELFAGGAVGELARPVLRIPARRVPLALRTLVAHFRASATPGEDLPAFLRRAELPALRQALAQAARLPASFEEEPGLFVDHGQQKSFDLSERGEGECAA